MTKELVFDPGHGGRDPGATANGICEKHDVLEVALAVRDRVLELYEDVTIIMTRTTDCDLAGPEYDDADDLDARCAIVRADEPARALVSFHDNAGDAAGKKRGLEQYVCGPASWRPAVAADGTINHTAPNSYEAALRMEPVLEAFCAEYGLPYCGIRTGDFHVIREIEAVGILLEAGYLTNKEDAALLKRPDFRRALVDAYARAIGAAFCLLAKPVPATKPVKVILPGCKEITGELRGDRTWIELEPGLWVPVRAWAELAGLQVIPAGFADGTRTVEVKRCCSCDG